MSTYNNDQFYITYYSYLFVIIPLIYWQCNVCVVIVIVRKSFRLLWEKFRLGVVPLANLTNENFKEKETVQLEKYVMSCQSRHRWGKYLMTPLDVSTRRLNNSSTALRCGRIFHKNIMRNLKHSRKNRFCRAVLCLTVEESFSRLHDDSTKLWDRVLTHVTEIKCEPG